MATDKPVATVKPTARRARPQEGAQPAGSPGLRKAKKYLDEVMTELRKAHWPSKPELIAQTQVVIGLLIVIGIFIAVWDVLLSKVLEGLFRLLGVTL
jgi:preprotein translocase subunit SecE